MENLPLLSVIGGIGIIITFILCYTGKKTISKEPQQSDNDSIRLFGITISIIVMIYLLRYLLMLGTSILSTFYLLTLIGGIVGLLPVLALGILNYHAKKKQKVP